MLRIGDQVPSMEVEALLPDGSFKTYNLDQYREGWWVLFFWPLDFTFVCPTEIRGFDALAPAFKKLGCTLAGASVDSVHAHRAWREHGLGKVNFPLIGDVSRALGERFGVLLPSGVATRATFIVNPDGMVENVAMSSLNVGRSPQETLRLVEALQTGELTGCEWKPGDAVLKAG